MSNFKLKLKINNFIIIFIVIVCTFSFFYIKSLKNNTVQTFETDEKIKLPVIMYHNISKKQSLVNKYCVSVNQFENDLKYIKSQGYNCITSAQLIDYVYNGKKLPKKPFMITFDDGYESFYVYAYPLLKKYDMKAIMSIVGKYTDFYSENEDHNIDYSYLNWKEVQELNKTDFIEIENHTYNLHEITAKRKGAGKGKGESFEQFKKVFKKDVQKLNSLILNYTKKNADVFTYPYGNIAKNSIDIVKEIGFKAAFTCSEKVNIISKNPECLYKIGRFNRDGRISTSQFFKKIIE